MPPSQKPIGCKWIFKIKADGMHQARLVAQGFSQIPGIDFTENFAPVLKDETLCILLIYLIIKKAESEQINVKTAFLYGELEELLFMIRPEGLEIGEDECVMLKFTDWFRRHTSGIRNLWRCLN